VAVLTERNTENTRLSASLFHMASHWVNKKRRNTKTDTIIPVTEQQQLVSSFMDKNVKDQAYRMSETRKV